MIYNVYLELQGELESGEKLLWAGQPKKGIRFTKGDAFLIPFSLFWCGFAILWVYLAAAMGAPLFFVLFGVPFVLIGLYLVFGRFIFSWFARANRVYGLTNSRMIFRNGRLKKKMHSCPIPSTSDLKMVENSDGSGTIYILKNDGLRSKINSSPWMPTIDFTSSFESIFEVKMVYNTIVKLNEANAKRAASKQ